MIWWIRPSVRMGAALVLPLIVPGLIISLVWLMPGDAAENLCGGSCVPSAVDALKERWELAEGPLHFYQVWLSNAVDFEFGKSAVVNPGQRVSELLWYEPDFDGGWRPGGIPTTFGLMLLTLVPLTLGSVCSALGWIPRRLDGLWQSIGMVPAVIFALMAWAYLTLTFSDPPYALKMGLGALVLALSDGTLAGAITGTRATFEEERKQRYAQMAILRGETVLQNTLPNVLPALVGQFRARILTVLSGAVVVEVMIGLAGLGDLLWLSTLKQDYLVLLGATFMFAVFSAGLLLVHGVLEIAVNLFVHRSPEGISVEQGAS